MEQTTSNGAVIEATGVDVSSAWAKRVQITGVDWKVLAGEYWIVGGLHGSGKTDLLMTIAGLHPAAAGSIRIFGHEATDSCEPETLAWRTRVGFVFKGGGRMFEELTVAENVALGLCYHRDCSFEQAREEVMAMLKLTELTDLAGETAQRLGVDWQQRVGLARALALKPDVMFFDEPAAGLESRHRLWWRDFLAQLSERKITIITATNDFALWQGGGHHRYALIKNGHWRVLEKEAEFPKIE